MLNADRLTVKSAEALNDMFEHAVQCARIVTTVQAQVVQFGNQQCGVLVRFHVRAHLLLVERQRLLLAGRELDARATAG